MDTIWLVIFAGVAILGFLASVFNWDWYFRLSRKSRRWDELFGRGVYRIINAVLCALFFVASLYFIFSGGLS